MLNVTLLAILAIGVSMDTHNARQYTFQALSGCKPYLQIWCHMLGVSLLAILAMGVSMDNPNARQYTFEAGGILYL